MKLHHTGFVVANIDQYAKKHPLGDCIVNIEDPIQNARLALYNNHSDVLIELIQPLGNTAFTWNALQKNGNHFHHFCYTVNNLETAVNYSSQFRMLKVLGPLPALLFEGKEVVFYYTRNQQVVEFLIDPYHL
jgi:methylmalonyl-CoA/ethylmalonyl-CoA epimerase